MLFSALLAQALAETQAQAQAQARAQAGTAVATNWYLFLVSQAHTRFSRDAPANCMCLQFSAPVVRFRCNCNLGIFTPSTLWFLYPLSRPALFSSPVFPTYI